MPFTARQGVVIVPFSGSGGTRLECLLHPAAGCVTLGRRQKPDWVVSHGALPARAW
ncbi:hypothetical protein KQH89_04140 [Vibrio cholerae]|uniref:hypothetical protein n=1 Tax=Vibrio cholerae TaxID=666 RepID=UPI001C0F8D1B|nr:hypothetical protein [Vibrio cholerae]MBU5221668.1 hypothetical protein [Vibrio cholerae]